DAPPALHGRPGDHDAPPLGHAEGVERPALLPPRDLLVRDPPGIGHGVLEQPPLPPPARSLRVGTGTPALRSALVEAGLLGGFLPCPGLCLAGLSFPSPCFRRPDGLALAALRGRPFGRVTSGH